MGLNMYGWYHVMFPYMFNYIMSHAILRTYPYISMMLLDSAVFAPYMTAIYCLAFSLYDVK